MNLPHLERVFSNLRREGYRKTSPRDTQYNCIAWAAGRKDRWWWPDSDHRSHWPRGVPREETLDAFIQAYRKHRFKVCDSANLEDGYEKIAIYAKDGEPTHAARLLPSGKWTSKCGECEDIEHNTLAAVGGDGFLEYGEAVVFMKRLFKEKKRRRLRRHGRWIRRKLRRMFR